MTDLAAAEQEWHDWIRDACAAVGADPAAVDVTGIHALTKEIAHGFARPMAPVGSYILGLAVGARAAGGAAARPAVAERGHPGDLPVGPLTGRPVPGRVVADAREGVPYLVRVRASSATRGSKQLVELALPQ